MLTAVLRALTRKLGLHIHSGLVGDAVLQFLVDAGALASGRSMTTGVSIGSPRLYYAISRPTFLFQPATATHDLQANSAIPRFVAINSLVEVNLLGQAFAE